MQLEEYILSPSFSPPVPIQVGDRSSREFLAVSPGFKLVASCNLPIKLPIASRKTNGPNQTYAQPSKATNKATYLRQPPQQRGAGKRQLRLPSPPGRSGVGLRPPAVREIPAGRHRGRRAAEAGRLERRCTWLGFGLGLLTSGSPAWLVVRRRQMYLLHY